MRSVLTFTYVDRKQSPFLDIWISYYSKIKNNKLVILYRNEIPKIPNKFIELVELINITNKIKNNDSYLVDISIFNEFQKIFLKENNVVMYSDVDEIIMHDDLNDLLQTFNSDFLVTTGVEIVQNVKLEPKIDLNRKILSQRNYMVYSKWYNKPLILRNPYNWTNGKHINATPYPNLFLIHLGKICLDIYTNGWEETYSMYPNYKYKNVTDFRTDYLSHWNDESHHEQPMTLISDNLKHLIDKNI